MAYEEALVAAGATVHKFEHFGSYQGDWWARVTLADGRSGWVHGSYGSCSGCDAFEAEFGYGGDRCSEHEWRSEEAQTCEACHTAKAEHTAKLASFGAGYLDGLMSQEGAEAKAIENLAWDCYAQKMLDFLRSESAQSADAVDPHVECRERLQRAQEENDKLRAALIELSSPPAFREEMGSGRE